MFCDLVGSTKLSLETDVEDLREILRLYQELCATAVEAHGGMIAQYLGDGVLAFFGYPISTEDATVRAAHAALKLLGDLEGLNKRLRKEFGQEVALRIALHSGRVLVGEMGGGDVREQHTVTGAVPNIAARIEGFAPINGIAVSKEVRAHLKSQFELEAMGAQTLKGVSEPVEVYAVLGLKRASNDLELPADEILFGREAEMERLVACWRRVEQFQETTIVTVTGDPGMGKTGLLGAFLRDEAAAEPLIFRGGIADRSSPFASLIHLLEGLIDAAPELRGDGEEKRFCDWFRQHGANTDDAALWLIELRRGASEAEGLDAKDARAEVLRVFSAFLISRGGSALIIGEDAHWIDPSTLDLIDQALLLAETPPSLLLLMTRPGAIYPWAERVDERIVLKGVSLEAAGALMKEVTKGVPIAGPVIRYVHEITSGAPLFLIEMTRSLHEGDRLRLERGKLRLEESEARAATPASLLELIGTRLDSLGQAKRLAQIASVLGRAAHVGALAAVAGLAVDEIMDSLETLVKADVMTYAASLGVVQFRHAMFQSAAYETLLRRRRASLHGAYVDWLEDHPEHLMAAQSETLGYHCAGAGRFDAAAKHYRHAGLIASRASANREAAAHFRRALDADGKTAEAELNLVRGLELQVRLAGALLAAEGPGAVETQEAYETAISLCEATPESDWHFPAFWGWWRIANTFPEMTARALRIVVVADRMKDPEFKLQAHHCMWANAFQIGDLGETINHAREGLSLYQLGPAAEQGALFGGHDAKVCALGEIALAEWVRGAADGACADMDLALSHAEALNHLGSTLHGLDIAATLHCHRRDPDAVEAVAARLVALGDGRDLEEYQAKGRFFLGWARSDRGDLVAGLRQMDEAYTMLKDVATNEDFPLFQCLRADALRQLGDFENAYRAVTEARQVIASEGVTYWAAEVERQEAEIAMAAPDPDHDRIAALLREATATARRQGALALELRASLSAARWSGRAGDLPEILSSFAPEAQGRDLRDAQAYLQSLGHD